MSSTARVGVVVVAAVGLLAASCDRQAARRKRQRRYANKLAPVQVTASRPSPPAGANPVGDKPDGVDILGLHVYAGPDYRAQTIRWDRKFARQVELANEVIEPLFAVRFVIRSTQAWDRQNNSNDMRSLVEELEGMNPGGDDEWVVGLVTSLTFASATFDDLGVARTGGRHMVVRSLANYQERDAIYKLLNTLDKAERERLYIARRQHKELIVFLHEFAHTLDVPHHDFPGMVMYSHYDPQTASFTAANEEFIKKALSKRHERSQALARAEEVRGQISAFDELLVEARAAADGKATLALLASAETALTALGDGHEERWGRLAALYQGQRAVSACERALGNSGQHRSRASIARWARQIRVRIGLPKDLASAGLSAATEPLYVTEMVAIREMIKTGSFAAAATGCRRARKRFPRAPGVDVLACDVAMRQQKYREARKHCQRALASFERASWAHYVMALLDLRKRKRAAAIAHLRRALVIDPDLTPARAQLKELGE